MTRLTVAALFGLTVFAAAPAAALVPLHQNERVVNSFYAIGLADEVRKNCPSISPRLLRAYNYLKSIESYARNAGYTDAQIEDLTENKAEKEKLRAKVRADLVRRGAKPGSPEGYCSVGREEIKNDTASGRLLKEN